MFAWSPGGALPRGTFGGSNLARTWSSISRAISLIGLQEITDVVLTLADTVALIGVPGAGLVE